MCLGGDCENRKLDVGCEVWNGSIKRSIYVFIKRGLRDYVSE